MPAPSAGHGEGDARDRVGGHHTPGVGVGIGIGVREDELLDCGVEKKEAGASAVICHSCADLDPNWNDALASMQARVLKM